jgi:DNA-binding response OmpR family regulator
MLGDTHARFANRAAFMSEEELTDKQGAQRLPRVLVLEEHADTLVSLGKLLSAIPVDAIPTATCNAARYAAKTLGAFDVLIADATLSDGDGVEVAIELCREYGCAVLIMSSVDPPTSGLPDEVDLWLVKPILLPQLRTAIQTLARA